MTHPSSFYELEASKEDHGTGKEKNTRKNSSLAFYSFTSKKKPICPCWRQTDLRRK
jgi:hypothetical protein